MRLSTFLITGAGLVAAHPGEDHSSQLLSRREFFSKTERSDLSHCVEKLRARGIEKRAMQRRKDTAAKFSKRGLLPRAWEDLNKSHHSGADYSLETSLEEIFAANTSCVLLPEAIEGPYYVVGERVRRNIREDQPGVPLILDIDLFDVDTCDPVNGLYVEAWNANATGVYSGVSSGASFSDAPENLQTTFMRGLQQTDDIGAVQFETMFPGHYDGRTQHVHVLVHTNATARENGTVADTTASHVGEVYFDQDLINEVEKISPYSTNEVEVTLNSEDFLLSSRILTSDPITQYVLLGESLEDGILSWISFGINTTYATTVSYASTYYDIGGVENPDAGDTPGGGGGGGPPSGGPSGTGIPPPASGTPQA